MLENSTCNILCKTTIPAASEDGVSDGQFINEKIAESYSMNWLIDGLPAARIHIDPQSGERFYSVGFELGTLDTAGTPLLNTHYDIVVEYHVYFTCGCEINGRWWREINTGLWGLLCSLRVGL
jgi:transmembrane 9 superfamily member 2/4